MKLTRKLKDVRTIDALLRGAEHEAHSRGDELPGAEHLLLSALALPDGSARSCFARVGADADAFGPAIAASHDDALRAVGVEPGDGPGDAIGEQRGLYRMSASGEAAFGTAGSLARSEDALGLTGAHVVAAVAGLEHGVSARALRTMGVDRENLAAAAAAELDALRSSA